MFLSQLTPWLGSAQRRMRSDTPVAIALCRQAMRQIWEERCAGRLEGIPVGDVRQGWNRDPLPLIKVYELGVHHHNIPWKRIEVKLTFLPQFRTRHTGQYRLHVHAVGGEFAVEAFAEGEEIGLARAIANTDGRLVSPKRNHRSDVDDVTLPPVHYARCNSSSEACGRHHVELDHGLETITIHVDGRPCHRDAGIVDQHGDVVRLKPGLDPANVLRIREVGLKDLDLSSKPIMQTG